MPPAVRHTRHRIAPSTVTRLRLFVSLAEKAFEEGVFDDSTPIRTARYRLVECTVVRQVAFLRTVLLEAITTAGYV